MLRVRGVKGKKEAPRNLLKAPYRAMFFIILISIMCLFLQKYVPGSDKTVFSTGY